MVQKCQVKIEVFIFNRAFLHMITSLHFLLKSGTYFTCYSYKLLDTNIPSETLMKKNISLMKRNNVILVLRFHKILCSLLVIY